MNAAKRRRIMLHAATATGADGSTGGARSVGDEFAAPEHTEVRMQLCDFLSELMQNNISVCYPSKPWLPLAEAVVCTSDRSLREHRQPQIEPRQSVIRALLSPRNFVSTLDRHDTGIVYELVRDGGDRANIDELRKLYSSALSPPQDSARENQRNGCISITQANKRFQEALIELQIMGFIRVNTKSVIKLSLFYTDL